MEAEYLRAKVGDALAEGMAETAMVRPADPVEFLGLWLAKYCDNIEAAKLQKEIQQRYQAEEEEGIAAAEVAKAAQNAEKSLVARDVSELETMNGIVMGESSAEKLQDGILEFLKTKTGASAAVIGVCDQVKETSTPAEGEEPVETVKDVISYTAATSNNKFMIGNQLVKTVDAEGVAIGAGSLSFGIFEKVEDIPAPTEEVPEPAAPEGGWPMKWATPFLQVAECVREPKIKYFRTPKLGGYLAMPYEYSYDVDAMNEGDGPDLVDGECPGFPEYTTTTNSTRGLVALDTLGTDGEFKEADCATAVEWTAKLGEGFGRVMKDKVEAERTAREGFKEKNMEQWAELEAQRTLLTEELQGLLDASKEEAKVAREAKHAESLGDPVEGEEPAPCPDEPEDEVAFREGCVKLAKLKECVVACKEMLDTLTGRTDAASRHWTVLQAALLFMKVAPEECDCWEKCVKVVTGEGFMAMLEAADVSVARDVLMVQSGESVQAAIEGVDIKNVERTHVPVAVVMEWLVQALVVHGAGVAVRTAKKAKAEEAGEAFEEAVSDNITDKPAEEAPPVEE